MNNTSFDFDSQIAPALRDFMYHNHADLNDTVDWVCEVFDVSVRTEGERNSATTNTRVRTFMELGFLKVRDLRLMD